MNLRLRNKTDGCPSPMAGLSLQHMDKGDTEAQAQELAYEFEVKEQDR